MALTSPLAPGNTAIVLIGASGGSNEVGEAKEEDEDASYSSSLDEDPIFEELLHAKGNGSETG